GSMALFNSTTGDANTANGSFSLYSNINGTRNIACGDSSLFHNINGSFNTVNGSAALFNNATGSDNTALGESAGFSSTGNGNMFLGKRAGYFETGNNKLYISGDSNRNMIYGDFSTGQVLIGKANPTGYNFAGARSLNVLGGILADSLHVALSGDWADYVFDSAYKLRSIPELGNYIKINKHLPNIPSAAEVASNGIDVGSMNAKLLEKIEELHLYILQQQTQQDDQSKKIELLKGQVETQEKNTTLLREQINELKMLVVGKNK
ncbi:MAG: hypothetical protein ABIN36_06150, partial [Ferruginibacter sp.]